MKSGAGDDPFAEPAVPSDSADTEESDADEADEADDGAEATEETGTAASDVGDESASAEAEPRTNGSAETTDTDDEGDENDGSVASEDGGSAASEGDASTQEIPYKFRRSSVKEGRTQRPIFVREAVEERESEFIRTLEEAVGEKVYKTDAMEAALIVAMDNPELVAEELREWGYDWE